MEDKTENFEKLNTPAEFNPPDCPVNPLMLIPIFLLSTEFGNSFNNQDMPMQEILKEMEDAIHKYSEAISEKEKELANLNSEQK